MRSRGPIGPIRGDQTNTGNMDLMLVPTRLQTNNAPRHDFMEKYLKLRIRFAKWTRNFENFHKVKWGLAKAGDSPSEWQHTLLQHVFLLILRLSLVNTLFLESIHRKKWTLWGILKLQAIGTCTDNTPLKLITLLRDWEQQTSLDKLPN